MLAFVDKTMFCNNVFFFSLSPVNNQDMIMARKDKLLHIPVLFLLFRKLFIDIVLNISHWHPLIRHDWKENC